MSAPEQKARSPVAGQYQDPCLVGLFDKRQPLSEFTRYPAPKGVMAIRTVQHYGRYAILYRHMYLLEAIFHYASLLSATCYGGPNDEVGGHHASTFRVDNERVDLELPNTISSCFHRVRYGADRVQ